MKSILYFLPKYDYPPPEYRLFPLIYHHTPPVDMVDQLLILDLPEEREVENVFSRLNTHHVYFWSKLIKIV